MSIQFNKKEKPIGWDEGNEGKESETTEHPKHSSNTKWQIYLLAQGILVDTSSVSSLWCYRHIWLEVLLFPHFGIFSVMILGNISKYFQNQELINLFWSSVSRRKVHKLISNPKSQFLGLSFIKKVFKSSVRIKIYLGEEDLNLQRKGPFLRKRASMN